MVPFETRRNQLNTVTFQTTKPSAPPARVLSFTTPGEAMSVAYSMAGQLPDGTAVVVAEGSQGEKNMYQNTSNDGRLLLYINFTKTCEIVSPETGRALNVSVPFHINAGANLDRLLGNPNYQWKFVATPDGSENALPNTYIGDVE